MIDTWRRHMDEIDRGVEMCHDTVMLEVLAEA